MPNLIYLSRRKNRSTRFVGIVFLAILAGLQIHSASAGEKRISVPLLLPFQQPTSAASSSSANLVVTPIYGVSENQFTQSLTHSVPQVNAASSSAAAVLNTVAAKPVVTPKKIETAKTIQKSLGTQKSTVAQKAAVIQKPKVVDKGGVTNAPALLTAYPVTVSPPPADLSTAAIKAQSYPAGSRDAFVAEFEHYVATQIAPFVPGAAVAIVADGEIKSLQTFGVKKVGTSDKVTPDTVFRLASVSKTIAATAAAIMVNEGQLSWDSKVINELENVKFKNAKYANQLTLKHLLSQSSGLPTHTYSHFIDTDMAYAETVRRLQYVNFVCPPGKCYAYQNVVYSLAGEMIKNKASMSYENYVEKKLFGPLEMRSASFGLENYQASPDRATPHTASGKRWVATTVTGNWYHVAPAAGVNASISDMSQFLLAQLGKRTDVLPLSALNQLQTRVTKNTPAQNHYGTRKGVGNTAYGLGWRVFDYGRYKNFVHHGGWVKGFRSEIVFNRELQIGMVFLTNSETRRARDIIFKFMDMHERAYAAAKKSAKKK